MFPRMIGEFIVRKNSAWSHVTSHNEILTSLPSAPQCFVAALMTTARLYKHRLALAAEH